MLYARAPIGRTEGGVEQCYKYRCCKMNVSQRIGMFIAHALESMDQPGEVASLALIDPHQREGQQSWRRDIECIKKGNTGASIDA